MQSDVDLPPKNGNVKRCKNSAETSRAMSTRVADLSDLNEGRTEAATDSAAPRRPVPYWVTLVTVPIV
jgi:hypothetical protein